MYQDLPSKTHVIGLAVILLVMLRLCVCNNDYWLARLFYRKVYPILTSWYLRNECMTSRASRRTYGLDSLVVRNVLGQVVRMVLGQVVRKVLDQVVGKTVHIPAEEAVRKRVEAAVGSTDLAVRIGEGRHSNRSC